MIGKLVRCGGRGLGGGGGGRKFDLLPYTLRGLILRTELL